MMGRGWSLQVPHQSCKVMPWCGGGGCLGIRVPNYFPLRWYSPSIQSNTLHPSQNGQPEILKGYISSSLSLIVSRLGDFRERGRWAEAYPAA